MAITVKNPFSDVWDKWEVAVKKVVGDNYSMDMSSIPSKFPYIRIFLMGNPFKDGDLDGNEAATEPSFQVESFSTGQKSLSKVYEIDSVSHEAMVSMGFRRTYGPSLVENIDQSIKRVISRYERVYTGYLN